MTDNCSPEQTKKYEKGNATISNKINQEIPNPTLRLVFQCFEGINML
jgi:hypothetical protein